MNILFDLITTCRPTGAGEYVRRVFNELEKSGCRDVVCVVDSQRNTHAYPELEPEALARRGFSVEDISRSSLSDIIARRDIGRVFIGCAQFWSTYPGIDAIPCEVYCVVHDLSHIETLSSGVELWTYTNESNARFIANWLKLKHRRKTCDALLAPFAKLADRNGNFNFIAVSDYTRNSLRYHMGVKDEQIEVLYSPERIIERKETIENERLAELLASGRSFHLMVSANKRMKNAKTAIDAFRHYSEDHKDALLVTVGTIPCAGDFHIALPFLSESDLCAAYEHCHALIYPSLFEGFGYPPAEAMKYSRPVLCSNVCSMPEVLGDAPIYFSPVYASDIYGALLKLDNSSTECSRRSADRYQTIRQRQESDLEKLIARLRGKD